MRPNSVRVVEGTETVVLQRPGPNSFDMTELRRPQSPDFPRSSGNNYVGITIGLSFYEKLFVRFKVRLLLPPIVATLSVYLKDGKERIS